VIKALGKFEIHLVNFLSKTSIGSSLVLHFHTHINLVKGIKKEGDAEGRSKGLFLGRPLLPQFSILPT